jgi:hypothetical protein
MYIPEAVGYELESKLRVAQCKAESSSHLNSARIIVTEILKIARYLMLKHEHLFGGWIWPRLHVREGQDLCQSG